MAQFHGLKAKEWLERLVRTVIRGKRVELLQCNRTSQTVAVELHGQGDLVFAGSGRRLGCPGRVAGT